MSSILRAQRVSSLPATMRHLVRPTTPRFILLVSLADLAAIMAAVGIGHLIPVGAIGFDASHSVDVMPPPGEGLLSVGIIALWLLSLLFLRTYGEAALGPLARQADTAARATALFLGTLAMISLLLRIPLDRGIFLVVPPVGLALILLGRVVCHGVLVRARATGHLVRRAVTLSGGAQAELLGTQIRRHPELGLALVGTLAAPAGPDSGPSPLSTSDTTSVIRAMHELDADTLLVPMTQAGVDAGRLRDLRWDLDAHGMRLVVVPPLSGVSGERMALIAGDDLALIHVATPAFSGAKYALKRTFDILASSVGILLLIPVWIAIAVVVKSGDGGPVVFRQERVGLNGRRFPMFKFRTMVPDAEAVLAALQREQARDAGNTVMFKMRDDPRITRPGHVLRRFSLDELPQLFNVWLGHMSLVGPRPPLLREVAGYEDMVHRRFHVRPGITGLWQTSGRSNLSWEDTVRLDLYYVENWTMRRDLLILLRTFRAVVSKDGAY